MPIGTNGVRREISAISQLRTRAAGVSRRLTRADRSMVVTVPRTSEACTEADVESASPFKGGYIVHFQGIDDRTVADTWRDRYLLVPADELEPLGEGEIYLHELLGMEVVLGSGEEVGSVEELFELPQGLTLEVRRPAGTVMIPYDRVVVHVDREMRRLTIDPPEGLLD